MKILRLYTRLPPLLGGMENHIAQLSKEQIKLGHKVSIYYNQGDRVTSDDVQVTKFPLYKIRPQFIGILLFYFLVYIKLVVSREKFDILHVHGDWSSLVLAKNIKNIINANKLIITIHDQLSNSFIKVRLLTFLLKTVDMVFTTGFDSASQLKKITNKDIVVQPSGVKKIFYEAYNKRFRKSSVQVITVANLFEKKNINMVLDIAKELPKINFLVVGDGPERLNLSNRIVNENIQNVVILGYRSSQEICSLYQSSDIFLLASLKEGTATSMLEAMACGLPIISSNAGGIYNIIGRYNYVFDVNDKDLFVNCLSSLSENTQLLQKISAKNIKLSMNYSWEKVADNINRKIQI